jgi:primosomal protein N' (replication factor Y)
MPVLRVALDLPLHRLFDYVAEASTADIGLRVRVPFGRGEKIGVIVEVVDSSEWPLAQLKPAGEILRDVPPFASRLFASVPLRQHLLSGRLWRSRDAGAAGWLEAA